MIFGIIHLLHCPCLILLPFCINNHTFDILYIEYFLGIMFSYTFIDGECPISYIYKKWKNPEYIAGSRIMEYPEIKDLLFFSPSTYFGTTTILYLGTLIHVIHRCNIPFTLFIIPVNSLLFYFYIIYRYRSHPLFSVIQDFHKIIIGLFILCLVRREIYI